MNTIETVLNNMRNCSYTTIKIESNIPYEYNYDGKLNNTYSKQ